MRVVIVDDESLIRMDLKDILQSLGHEVVGEGTNGVESLHLARTLRPDVVLMDVKMPELDGIEAARQIGFHHYAPVVLLTAYSQDDLVKKARESGVFGYLIKPLREELLVPMLEMAIGRFQDEVAMREEMASLAQTLEDRKIITKATGIIVSTYHISEDDAFKRMRTLAMQKQMTLVAVATEVIKSKEKQQKNN